MLKKHRAFRFLLYTVNKMINNIFKVIAERCTTLDDYYIPTRYPDALPGQLADGLSNEKDAKEAVSVLKETIDFVKKIL